GFRPDSWATRSWLHPRSSLSCFRFAAKTSSGSGISRTIPGLCQLCQVQLGQVELYGGGTRGFGPRGRTDETSVSGVPAERHAGPLAPVIGGEAAVQVILACEEES